MSKMILIDEAVATQVLEALEDYECGKETTAYLAKVERATAALREARARQPAPLQQDRSSINPGWCQGCTPDNCHGCEGRYTGVEGFERASQQRQAIDVAFLKQVLSVAICGLYEHFKDDVLRVFTLDELQTVVDLSDPLRPQKVEDIYKRAWVMLAAAHQAQQPTNCRHGGGADNVICAGQCRQELVSGVVIRDGFPTLLKDGDIKQRDERLFKSSQIHTWPRHKPNASLHDVIWDGIGRDLSTEQICEETRNLATPVMVDLYRKSFEKQMEDALKAK